MSDRITWVRRHHSCGLLGIRVTRDDELQAAVATALARAGPGGGDDGRGADLMSGFVSW